MLSHVHVLHVPGGARFTCDHCNSYRVLEGEQHEDDSVLFGYLYLPRLEAWEREHDHRGEMARLTPPPRFASPTGKWAASKAEMKARKHGGAT